MKDDKEALSAYERWELPVVGGGASGAAGSHRLSALTAAQMERLQQQARAEAHKEGRAAGFVQGLEEGRQAAAQELQPLAARAEQLLEEMSGPLQALEQETETILVELAMEVAKQLVYREITIDPEIVLHAVRGAIAVLPVSARGVRVHLHPQDALLMAEAMSVNEDEQRWEISEDATLERGACRIETDSSHIDASLKSRMAVIISDVLGGQPEGEDER